MSVGSAARARADDVGLDRARGRRCPGTGRRARRRAGGPRVVVGQAVDHRLERDEPGRREHARLAHPAAEPGPVDARACDRRHAVPQSSEPTGAPSPFDRQNITVSARRARAPRATRRARPTAFQMRAPSQCTASPPARARGDHRVELGRSPRPAARGHVRVLDATAREISGRWCCGTGERVDHVARVSDAVGVGERPELDARVRRRAGVLVAVHVGARRRTAPRCRAAEQPQRELVGHRPRRHVERGLHAEQRRGQRLSRLTVGSSPYASSPTSASAIARRISGVGVVTVSDRRSTPRRSSRASPGQRTGRIEALLRDR